MHDHDTVQDGAACMEQSQLYVCALNPGVELHMPHCICQTLITRTQLALGSTAHGPVATCGITGYTPAGTGHLWGHTYSLARLLLHKTLLCQCQCKVGIIPKPQQLLTAPCYSASIAPACSLS